MDRSDIVSAVKEALTDSLGGLAAEIALRQRIADLEEALRAMLGEYRGVYDLGTHQSESAKRACVMAEAALDWPRPSSRAASERSDRAL